MNFCKDRLMAIQLLAKRKLSKNPNDVSAEWFQIFSFITGT
jgi:hypothetical protein